MNNIEDIKEAAKGIKNIIAIGSGKGGVGKSMVTTNLSIAIAKKGFKTAVLDLDIYGPTIPSFFGIYQRPLVENYKMLPVEKNRIKIMSIGFLIEDFTAVIWRGPMIMSMVKQFFTDVNWGEIDYMFIDLPPGTGDAPLTIAQILPLKGGIIVTTPQKTAALTAVRAYDFFNKLNIPVFGTVINMEYFICNNCKIENHIFTQLAEKLIKEKTDMEVIIKLPFYENFMEEIFPGQVNDIQFNKEAQEKFKILADYIIEKIGK